VSLSLILGGSIAASLIFAYSVAGKASVSRRRNVAM
jgi:hypothetical protein